jgi:uncharacterized membrane protein
MLITSIWVVAYFLVPMFIIWLCIRFPWIDKIGAVLVNYGIGVIIGNLGILPEGFDKIQNFLTTILIPIAIPLLLFTADIKTWVKMAGKTLLAFVLGTLALLISIYVGYYIFHTKVDKLWEVSGMLVGVYTGGTPNLAAIKTALNVPADRFIITHSSDTFVCMIYLFFILSMGQKLFGLFLPKFKLSEFAVNNINADAILEDTKDFVELIKKKNWLSTLKALGLSVFIFAIGGGISMLVPEKTMMLTAILTITTLALLLSAQPSINKMKNSFTLGMYFIHVFSLVVASMADFTRFSAVESMDIFFYVALVVYATVIIHLILAYFFKIDTDTFIIVSMAMIFSPPFVPVVAASLRNKYIIISGMTAGIIGYAIGNYLGVFVALSLK